MPSPPTDGLAHYLDMPELRRAAATAHVAVIAATARKVALTLPIQADADDFRRVMVEAAPTRKRK